MDADWMRRAISLAEGTRPHPNPRVGAVIVKEGLVIAEAAHPGAGQPHAERLATTAAGSRARAGTLYVTLEPCVHHGRTPPCVEALIGAGISRVVVASVDPDPRNSGRGIAALQAAGLDVETGVLEAESEALDPAYFHHRRTGRPRVTLKAALTLDGQLAASDGSSQWITSEGARRDAHAVRGEADAVMVGAGTILLDDPRLTVRLDGYEGPQPTPVAIVGRRSLPLDARLFEREALVVAPGPRDELPAEVLVVPDVTGERVDLSKTLELLAERGILELLVEGGSRIFRSLLEVSRVDRLILYYGGRIAGGAGIPLAGGEFFRLDDARAVTISSVRKIDGDLRVVAVPKGD